jgi:hypothetical protein
LKQQPWVEWDRANKKFIYHKTGTESYVLKTQMKDKLYRGASEIEFNYLLAIKWLMQPTVDTSHLPAIKSSIAVAMKYWDNSNDSNRADVREKISKIYESLETVANRSQEDRMKDAKVLVSLVSRYPAIMLGVVRETAAKWAFEMDGRDALKVVEVFDVNSKNFDRKIFPGFYAGTETDYFEIGFVTPEARLFLISRMEEEPITRDKAEIEFPYLKNAQ